MNLRQWTSNCNEFLDSLPEGEKLSGKSIKMFGTIWNRIEEYLQIPIFKRTVDGVDITRQQILSDVMTRWV